MNSSSKQYPGLGKIIGKLSKIELNLSCSDLPKFDLLSNTDPKVYVFVEKRSYNNNTVKKYWEKYDTTETINNNNNPVFTKSIMMDYNFEENLNLRFIVFDMDNDDEDFTKNEYIGYIDKSLSDIIAKCNDNILTCTLDTSVPPDMKIDNTKTNNYPNTTKLYIRVSEVNGTPFKLKFSIKGKNLDKKDLFGKSDPFIKVSIFEDNNSFFNVFETPVIYNTLDPDWGEFEIIEKNFNKGNLDKLLTFEVYDYDSTKYNDLIGSFNTSTRELLKNKSYKIINESLKIKNNNYDNSGVIIFDKIERYKDEPYSFLDYLMTGTKLSFYFAIDFTESNGSKDSPNSLHYNNSNYDINNYFSLNEYEKAILSIGKVFEHYNFNKDLKIYGYGGKFFNKDIVEYDCALTGDNNNPSVLGVSGILDAYHKALQTVELGKSNIENFAPLIKKVSLEARKTLPPLNSNKTLPKYYVLTVITNGCISDIEKIKEMIIDADDVPLSIVIVGVGNGDFIKMKELDGDNNVLKYNNMISKRDIIQFVPISKFIDNPDLLAAETLKEIPNQLIEYTKSYKFRPNFY